MYCDELVNQYEAAHQARLAVSSGGRADDVEAVDIDSLRGLPAIPAYTVAIDDGDESEPRDGPGADTIVIDEGVECEYDHDDDSVGVGLDEEMKEDCVWSGAQVPLIDRRRVSRSPMTGSEYAGVDQRNSIHVSST